MILIPSLTLGTKNILFILKDTVIDDTANSVSGSFLLLQQVGHFELKVKYPLLVF